MTKFKSIAFLLLISWLGPNTLYAQGTMDSERLGKLEYMIHADRVNCDSMAGTNLASRICLNLAFQQADSMMCSLMLLLLV